jgi:uncharacterized protein (TIGR02145 family)
MSKLLIYSSLLLTLVIAGCTKEVNELNNELKHEMGTVTDVDGKVYKTVKIGKQWWMAEDLQVKHFRNGDSIQHIANLANSFKFDSATWVSTQAGAYADGEVFGMLYNGHAVTDTRNIAPEGWHIPTDDEWKQLEKQLGMDAKSADSIAWRGKSEGNKLRVQSMGEGKNFVTGWKKPDEVIKYEIWGSNESGFSAMGAGSRIYNSKVTPSYETGFWWSSTIYNNQLWYRFLQFDKGGVFRFYGPKNYGFSVRCVKD